MTRLTKAWATVLAVMLMMSEDELLSVIVAKLFAMFNKFVYHYADFYKSDGIKDI